MIIRRVKLVIPNEDDAAGMMVGDLRLFVAEVRTSPDDTDVTVEQRLHDGRLCNVFEAEWYAD